VISLTLDREDLMLIIDFMRVGVSTTKEIIEAESQVEVSLALRLQHEVDQAEAVLEQLENME